MATMWVSRIIYVLVFAMAVALLLGAHVVELPVAGDHAERLIGALELTIALMLIANTRGPSLEHRIMVLRYHMIGQLAAVAVFLFAYVNAATVASPQLNYTMLACIVGTTATVAMQVWAIYFYRPREA